MTSYYQKNYLKFFYKLCWGNIQGDFKIVRLYQPNYLNYQYSKIFFKLKIQGIKIVLSKFNSHLDPPLQEQMLKKFWKLVRDHVLVSQTYLGNIEETVSLNAWDVDIGLMAFNFMQQDTVGCNVFLKDKALPFGPHIHIIRSIHHIS